MEERKGMEVEVDRKEDMSEPLNTHRETDDEEKEEEKRRRYLPTNVISDSTSNTRHFLSLHASVL